MNIFTSSHSSIPSKYRSASILQRACACGNHTPGGGECEACKQKRLQRSATAAEPAVAPPIVHDVLRSPGQPLDAATRAFMEPRFGQDFSRVRVHTDGQAAVSARAVNAHAYTVGTHIAFGAGQYTPGSHAGRGLLAHELAHVVQQSAQLQRQADHLTITSPTGAAENEAAQAAHSVLRGSSFTVTRGLVPQVARSADTCTYGEIRSWAITSLSNFTAPTGLADAKASIGAVCSNSNCHCTDGSNATAPGDRHAWSNIVAANGGTDRSGGGTHMCVGSENCGFVHQCSCPDGRVVERLTNVRPSGQTTVTGKGTLYFYNIPRRGQCPPEDRGARCGQPERQRSDATDLFDSAGEVLAEVEEAVENLFG
jgi:hypothetical protein